MKIAVAYWVESSAPERAIAVARRLRAAGVVRLQAYTPFGIPELEDVLGLGRPRLLPALVLGAGLSGVVFALLVLWWTAAVDYPLDVGGRPLNSLPTDLPIMFETGVLFAAGTAFFGCLVLSGLPRLDAPLAIAGFERTTTDRFWIGVDALDPAWRPELLERIREGGPVDVHTVEVEVAR